MTWYSAVQCSTVPRHSLDMSNGVQCNAMQSDPSSLIWLQQHSLPPPPYPHPPTTILPAPVDRIMQLLLQVFAARGAIAHEVRTAHALTQALVLYRDTCTRFFSSFLFFSPSFSHALHSLSLILITLDVSSYH